MMNVVATDSIIANLHKSISQNKRGYERHVCVYALINDASITKTDFDTLETGINYIFCLSIKIIKHILSNITFQYCE